MNKEPIYLSVVLSTYNDEKYIAESIQSILDQTYPYFEFIIVNDGSKDGTLDIIKSFQDNRIVLIDKPNTGLIDSLNTGVNVAKYDWIARMDGDDIAEPDRFEMEVRAIKERVAVISSQCTIINSVGEVTGTTHFLTFWGIPTLFTKISFFMPIVHPVSIFNKNIFEQVGGYDPNMYLGEDNDLWIKMLSKGSLILLNKRLLRLRKHNNNISAHWGKQQELNQWIRVYKGAKGINRCLSKEEHDDIGIKIKNIKFYGQRRSNCHLIEFLKCIRRYLVLKKL